MNKCIQIIFEKLGADIKNNGSYGIELKMKYGIYKSLNVMDFCVILYTNFPEFSLYLSNKICSIEVVKDKPKYAVYTVVGIDKKFKHDSAIAFKNSVLVTRIRVKRKFWNNIDKLIKDDKRFEKIVEESDAHGLIGRYDFSIRINDRKNISVILECLICYKINGSLPNNEDLLNKLKNSNELIFRLLNCKFVEYINERILMDVYDNMDVYKNDSNSNFCNFSDTKMVAGQEYQISIDSEKLIEKFEEVKNYIKDHLSIYPDIIKYLNKLNDIIYICNGLYSVYDTQISITMFREYVYSFLNLFELSCKAVEESNLKNWRDIITNLKEALNYLQQFIKIVTSINSSSFQAPKYDIVQNECSIAKFPIAYSQLLNNVCDLYYKHRKKLGEEIDDPELAHFPRYKALMIPYMQKIESEFFMMVLFAQGISLDWKKEKEKWIEFNDGNNIVPIFVVCQNLEHYVDVSSVMILSFHEIGHYNNSVTRTKRNDIVLKICCYAIANKIATAYCYTRDVSLSVQYNLIMENAEIRKFFNIISDVLYDTVKGKLVGIEDAPNIIFLEKIVDAISSLIKPEPPYYDEEILYGNYATYTNNLIIAIQQKHNHLTNDVK